MFNCKTCQSYKNGVLYKETEEGNSIIKHLIEVHKGADDNGVVDSFLASKRPEVRDSLKNLYKDTQSYLDRDFLKHFEIELWQRVWEMSVCKYLLEDADHNLIITRRKDGEGPDFETGDAYFECIYAKQGTGNDKPKFLLNMDTGLQFVPNSAKDAIVLRITNAFQSKVEKYNNYKNKKWFDLNKKRYIFICCSVDGYQFSVGNIDLNDIMFSDTKSITKQNGESISLGILKQNNDIDGVYVSPEANRFNIQFYQRLLEN